MRYIASTKYKTRLGHPGQERFISGGVSAYEYDGAFDEDFLKTFDYCPQEAPSLADVDEDNDT